MDDTTVGDGAGSDETGDQGRSASVPAPPGFPPAGNGGGVLPGSPAWAEAGSPTPARPAPPVTPPAGRGLAPGGTAWSQAGQASSGYPPPYWGSPSGRPYYTGMGPVAPFPGPVVRRAPLGARGWVTVVVVAALVGGGLGGLIGAALARNDQQTIVRQFFPNASVLAKPQDVQEVLAKVLPAVVSIDTQAGQAGNGPFGGGGVVEGAGTGMILSPGGEILTNNHVVAGATTVTVTLYGQTKERAAHVVGNDPSNDVALVQIDGGVSGLPTVTLGNSDAAQVGDSVIAIGNALALAGGPTVTTGIVSAKGRTLSAQDPVTSQTENLTGLLQTDAAINPGNSGGPLVNSAGQVVGMNTAVAGDQASGTSNAQAQNIGFALAIDQVKPLIDQLRKGGTVQPSQAYLGVQAQTVTPDLRQTYNLTPTRGAVVGAVSGDPARSAGIQVGDVIVAVDGTEISSADDLVATISNHKPGDRVTLTVVRGSQQLQVPVTLGTRPAGLQ